MTHRRYSKGGTKLDCRLKKSKNLRLVLTTSIVASFLSDRSLESRTCLEIERVISRWNPEKNVSVNESEISSALRLLRNALRLGDMSEGTDRLPHLYC